MNIVFAYHAGDCELALESAKAIAAQGINMGHRATICCIDGTPLLPQITEELKKVFPNVGRIVAQDGFDGWPLGPNQMFADASSYCYQFDDPWYFWEPDCVPMASGWIDKLEAEFNNEKGKILGSLVGGGVAPSGKNVYQLIIGSAIYPSKFLNGCTIAANLYNYNLRYRDANAVPEPWDVRCRWEFMKYGRNTDLIKTYWKSVNYQYRDGSLVFFAESPEANDIQSITCPDRVVDLEALVVHGCKDGSLHRLVYDKNAPPIYIEPKIERIAEEAVEVVQSIVRFEKPSNENSEQQAFLEKLKKNAKLLGKTKKPRKKKTE